MSQSSVMTTPKRAATAAQDAYALFYRHALFPLWEGVRGRPTPAFLQDLQRSQWRSTDELQAFQTGELRRLLLHARAHVPAYRQRLDEAGLDPMALRDATDLRRLPLLRREEARALGADLRAEGMRHLLHKSTSGTTGEPFRFAYDLPSEHWRQAIKLRGYAWAGYAPGQRTVHYWGPPAVPPTGKALLKVRADRLLRQEVYLDCARQGAEDLKATVMTLCRLRPRTLIGFTQATVELARHVVRHRLRDWPAMNVICGAERLYPQDRPLLDQAFGEDGSGPSRVFETYGCREFMLIASECPAHEGLHLAMENLVVEIVDEDGRPVSEGEAGLVAVTDLHNLGMPLIRYVTGDRAVALPAASRCSCGRGLLRLQSLEGRQADLLRGPDGRAIPGIVFNSIFAALGDKVDQFQAVQRRAGDIDLAVVPGPRFDDTVIGWALERLRPYLGEVKIAVRVVREIPAQPSGKRRHVVVEG